MSSEPTFTFPPPIVDMIAKGLVSMEPGTAGCGWHIIGEWSDTLEPTKTHKIHLKTDSGWITIVRGPEMERT